ncbi:hypothetical protein PR202_gb19582 [Eleusine coracana subsp. coracana]|uniref:Uncharacterized protein n=1 Tax=Eleusine coracana subsp. coracana TaxID=191504 RepID=A0AAV5FAD8_ELECO|nr:hypothetical protein PR202_gb19582 [Eleusine coracana subsp. coracana]
MQLEPGDRVDRARAAPVRRAAVMDWHTHHRGRVRPMPFNFMKEKPDKCECKSTLVVTATSYIKVEPAAESGSVG